MEKSQLGSSGGWHSQQWPTREVNSVQVCSVWQRPTGEAIELCYSSAETE